MIVLTIGDICAEAPTVDEVVSMVKFAIDLRQAGLLSHASNAGIADPEHFALDKPSADLARQWFNAVQDLNRQYLEKKDVAL